MFPAGYFAPRYFAPRYWPKVGALVPVTSDGHLSSMLELGEIVASVILSPIDAGHVVLTPVFADVVLNSIETEICLAPSTR